jgi:tight adherence protein C
VTTTILIAVIGAAVAAAVLAGLAAAWVMEQGAPERRRLRSLSTVSTTGVVATAPGSLTESLDPVLVRLSRLAPKSPKDMGRLQRRMTRAGYPQLQSAVYFSLAQIALPMVVGGIVFLVTGVWWHALLAAGAAYTIPGFYVDRLTFLRKKAIRNGLPDALDLLTVCVEAGSGLDQAIAKAAEELQIAHPVISDELRILTTEVRAGKPRLEAFQNFAQRTGVDDVRSLVSMLVQTDRFGTSVAQALRTHAETSRTKRRQRAEERAAKVSVKLVFPLALCLFPALYIVCFGPVVVRIYRAFFAPGT